MALRLVGDVVECTACAKTFGTIADYDAHRVKTGYRDHRCMSASELIDASMRPAADGAWRRPPAKPAIAAIGTPV